MRTWTGVAAKRIGEIENSQKISLKRRDFPLH